MDCRPVAVGSPDFNFFQVTVVLSDLVMIHMMSVKYAFSLLLVFGSASDASVFAGPGLNQPGQRPLTDTEGSQLPEACRLMTWHHDRAKQQAIIILALYLAPLQKN
jgi:hypothetical protein